MTSEPSTTGRASRLYYRRRRRLQGEHYDTITSLRFSPHGKFLASSSIDGKLCIWSTASGQLLHILKSETGFISLAWVNELGFLTGLEDGILVSVRMTQTDISATGFAAHTHPVEHIASQLDVVATAAHHDIKIWRFVQNEQWMLIQTLDRPPSIGQTRTSPVLVTSLIWASQHSPNALLVAYLHHGVIVWDAQTGAVLRNIVIKTPVGHASLSPDQRWLAISNLSTGFDVYDIISNLPPRQLDHENNDFTAKLRLPTLFAHRGEALLGGSTCGIVPLRDLRKESSIHDLVHHDEPIILALAEYYDYDNDIFFIATGTAGQGPDTYIQIWQAQQITQLQPSLAAPVNSRNARNWGTMHVLWKATFVGAVTIGLLAIYYRGAMLLET